MDYCSFRRRDLGIHAVSILGVRTPSPAAGPRGPFRLGPWTSKSMSSNLQPSQVTYLGYVIVVRRISLIPLSDTGQILDFKKLSKT